MADGRTIKGKLAVRFAILLTGILVVAIGVYSVWSSNDQRLASEEKVLQEARLLSQQMSASWDYVDAVQDYINYNDDGRYDFKGIYCSVAGKSIALRFTQQTDCTIRYTRENPRTPTVWRNWKPVSRRSPRLKTANPSITRFPISTDSHRFAMHPCCG